MVESLLDRFLFPNLVPISHTTDMKFSPSSIPLPFHVVVLGTFLTRIMVQPIILLISHDDERVVCFKLTWTWTCTWVLFSLERKEFLLLLVVVISLVEVQSVVVIEVEVICRYF